MVDGEPGGDVNTGSTSGDNSGWFSSISNSIKEGFQSLKDGFKGFISSIVDPLKTLLEYLNPVSDKFFLKVALVPRSGYFQDYFTELKGAFDVKLPIVGQLFDFFKVVANATILDAPAPQFNINYMGHSMSIIDFSYVIQYRTIIVNFTRFIAWFFFLKRLYNRVPSMIY